MDSPGQNKTAEALICRLLEDSMYADVNYFVQEEKFPTHRCILSARSEYFAEMFQSKWKDKDKIYLKNKLVLPLAFKSVLQYLYTGRLETLVDNVQDCVRVARQCRLPKLLEQIESNLKETFYFESSKPGVRVTTLCIESLDKIGLRADFGFLAGLALPKELRPWVHGELPFEPECFPTFADIGFIVEGHRFLCHKAFFCGRSDYFEALLSDHFGENDLSEEIPCVTLHDITVDIFTQVIYYIYQDTCELCSANAYDTLCTADLYLLHGLKRQCASWIANHLKVNNVVPILKSARVFNLHQLQDCCMKFIADNIHEVIHLNEFADLVQYDAAVVNEREETDSIEIIDEIRYYITNFVQTFSKMEEATEKLQLIDDLLEQLNLVC